MNKNIWLLLLMLLLGGGGLKLFLSSGKHSKPNDIIFDVKSALYPIQSYRIAHGGRWPAGIGYMNRAEEYMIKP